MGSRRFKLRAALLLLVGMAGLLLNAQVNAHFRLKTNIRIAHIEHLSDGVRMYLRLPAPYVLAAQLGQIRDDGSRRAAPYTYNRIEDGQLMHYLDFSALRHDPIGLGTLVAAGHRLIVDGETVFAEVERVRWYTAERQPAFATLNQAKQAFESSLMPIGDGEVFVGDTVIDVALRYRTGGALYSYSLSSHLDPGLEDQDKTANLILDHFTGGTQIFRAAGLLVEPVAVNRSALAAAWTFILEGARHILEGSDHVLFVVCLVIGATTISGLLWRVTGFTIGHSLTLASGFFGFVPRAAWFIPAIETGIALSIIYAAVIALAQREDRSSFFVTAAIGLLHGLGFSFVLREILQIDAPNLWQSLLAFNLGVEGGQIAIVLAIWPLLLLIRTYKPSLSSPIQWLVATPCIAVAALWAGERLVMLSNAIDNAID